MLSGLLPGYFRFNHVLNIMLNTVLLGCIDSYMNAIPYLMKYDVHECIVMYEYKHIYNEI